MPKDLFASDNIIDPDKDYTEELVGEGRKYANVKELSRSRLEADAYIARLEDEQRRIREDLANRIKQEEFLDKLNKALIDPQEPSVDPKKPADTQVDIEKLLEQKITERDQAHKAEQNLNLVIAKLEESLGPNYSQQIKRQATELGMSEQSLRALASANPKAFFKLLGLDDKSKDPAFTSPPKTQFSSGLQAPPGGKRGDSYYEEIRKTKPTEYWSPKIQNEMFNRIKEIGEETFYNS